MSDWKNIRFRVDGRPRPGGSKRFIGRGKPLIDAGKHTPAWKEVVRLAARQEFKGPLIETAIIAQATFYLPRPKDHLRTRAVLPIQELKPSAPNDHLTYPDVTKLWRAVEDALTGIFWADDSQIIKEIINKRYSDWRDGDTVRWRPIGVEICISYQVDRERHA